MTVQNRVVSIYTEATPNPETMKFVLNKILFLQNSADFPTRADAEGISPLALALYDQFDYVQGVFIMNNFITITKTAETEWFELIPELREFIRNYVANGGEIINEQAYAERIQAAPVNNTNEVREGDDAIVVKIKEMLTKYVQPAVEMDGGSIVFRSYENGVVRLGMQGSCSGCPSSSITLKAGIEGLLKRMVPEVQAVEAEDL